MENRITGFENSDSENGRGEAPHAIGDILAELLARYQARFPGVKIMVIEVSAAA